jgi:predicted phosphodiesterase
MRSNGQHERLRVAVLSDIHGNVVALDAVLADMALHGPFDEIVVAGDLVWSGPWPAEVVDRVQALNATVIQGNTDAFFRPEQQEPPAGKEPGRFEVHMAWMQEQLGPQRVAFLGRLPFSHRISPAGRGAPGGDHDLLIVHANPYDLERPILPQMRDSDLDEFLLAGEMPACEMLAFGHVHVPYIRHWRGRTLVDVASVGLPMDRDPRAAYAILQWDGAMWQAEHRRVFYDAPMVAHRMRTCGMPRGKHFADRLMAAGYQPMGQPAFVMAE